MKIRCLRTWAYPGISGVTLRFDRVGALFSIPKCVTIEGGGEGQGEVDGAQWKTLMTKFSVSCVVMV